MSYTRRDVGKIALASLPGALRAARPDLVFGGVWIGIITYSFRALPSRCSAIGSSAASAGSS